VARVKKIINSDEDIPSCSNNAAFVITVATEMFLQHLVEQSYNIVKSERKPRRNIQYRDVANAVARVENLEFLSDVVPKTVPYKQVKQRAAKEATGEKADGIAKGQGTLDGHMGGGKGEEEALGKEEQAGDGARDEGMEVDDEEVEEDDDEEGTRSPEPVSRKAADDEEMDDS